MSYFLGAETADICWPAHPVFPLAVSILFMITVHGRILVRGASLARPGLSWGVGAAGS